MKVIFSRNQVPALVLEARQSDDRAWKDELEEPGLFLFQSANGAATPAPNRLPLKHAPLVALSSLQREAPCCLGALCSNPGWATSP